jgi:hypothetical protein
LKPEADTRESPCSEKNAYQMQEDAQKNMHIAQGISVPLHVAESNYTHKLTDDQGSGLWWQWVPGED